MTYNEFLNVLIRHLPILKNTEEIDPLVELQNYGLDSMTSISLLLDLEEKLDMLFPDEFLMSETFENTNALWEKVQRILEQRGQL